MYYKPILMPLVAMLVLTGLVWLYMYVTRLREMGRRRIDPQDLKTREMARSLLTDSAAPADNFRNLFEIPVLFYVAVLLSLVLMLQDPMLVYLSWGFVATRYGHSLVHCTYNRVLHRFALYLAGCGFILLIWIRLVAFILAQ
jgi:hypothetical protein